MVHVKCSGATKRTKFCASSSRDSGPLTVVPRCYTNVACRDTLLFLVIKTFLHKGLKELDSTGKSALIPPQLIARCKIRLDALQAATSLGQLNVAGFNFHQLRRKPQRYSIHVNGPWAITFEWEDSSAVRVDLEQYH